MKKAQISSHPMFRVIPDSEDYAFVLHICEKGVARGNKEGFFGAVGLNMENLYSTADLACNVRRHNGLLGGFGRVTATSFWSMQLLSRKVRRVLTLKRPFPVLPRALCTLRRTWLTAK